MKTAEEILENIMCCTIEEDADLDVKSNYYYQHDDVVRSIKQAQKEAYNQALDHALSNAVVETIIDETGIHRIIHKDSILRLKL